MQFSIKEWRRMYDMVTRLGQELKDSYPTYDENMQCFPPIHALTREEQREVSHLLTTWVNRTKSYLDQCGMRVKAPLWNYVRQDETTHASHSEFAYAHLLNRS